MNLRAGFGFFGLKTRAVWLIFIIWKKKWLVLGSSCMQLLNGMACKYVQALGPFFKIED